MKTYVFRVEETVSYDDTGVIVVTSDEIDDFEEYDEDERLESAYSLAWEKHHEGNVEWDERRAEQAPPDVSIVLDREED